MAGNEPATKSTPGNSNAAPKPTSESAAFSPNSKLSVALNSGMAAIAPTLRLALCRFLEWFMERNTGRFGIACISPHSIADGKEPFRIIYGEWSKKEGIQDAEEHHVGSDGRVSDRKETT
jgi:hypothetical protein